MLLYHGSPYKFDKIEERQASSPHSSVPEEETEYGIYLTSDYGFAVAIAGMSEGENNIDPDEKTIKFQNPQLFDPEKEVYVYIVDSEKIPQGNIKKLKTDNHQYKAFGIGELIPDKIEKIKAIEVEKYYKFLNWKPENSENEETKFKIR